MHERQPFFAAVGIENSSQLHELQDATRDIRQEMHAKEGYQLGRIAVGMLMSEKTGLKNTPNRHGPIYPTQTPAHDIAYRRYRTDLSIEPLRVVVHYNTDHPEYIASQLQEATEQIQQGIDGVQVNNLEAHEIDGLRSFRQERRMPAVLQIHRRFLNTYTPGDLTELLRQKREACDYIWLDMSGGEGEPLNREQLLPFIKEITEDPELADKGVGLAGGLNGENIQKIEPLLREEPNLSWDAQRGVQTKEDGQYRFDTDKAAKFLQASFALRKKYPPEV